MKKSILIAPLFIALLAIDCDAQIVDAPSNHKGIPVVGNGNDHPVLDRRVTPTINRNRRAADLPYPTKPIRFGVIRERKEDRK